MNEEEITRTLDAYAAAKNSHDVGAILSLCSDDSFYASVPLGGRVEGKEALGAFYSALFEGLPDYFGDFDGTAFGSDSAVVWGRFGGTLTDEFMGMEVEAGRRVEIPVTFVCTFRDGLLTGDTGYFDAATLAEQIGVPLDAVRAERGLGRGRDFVDRFQSFWRQPSPELIPDLVAPHAVTDWPGAVAVSGNEYPEHIAGILEMAPDLRLEVTEQAEAGETVFISWRASATIGGDPREWSGIDRFHVQDGRVVEGLVVYDTAALLGVEVS